MERQLAIGLKRIGSWRNDHAPNQKTNELLRFANEKEIDRAFHQLKKARPLGYKLLRVPSYHTAVILNGRNVN